MENNTVIHLPFDEFDESSLVHIEALKAQLLQSPPKPQQTNNNNNNTPFVYVQMQWILFIVIQMFLLPFVQWISRSSPWWAVYLSWMLEPTMLFLPRKVRHRILVPRHNRRILQCESPVWGRIARHVIVYGLCTFCLMFFAQDSSTWLVWYTILIPLGHLFRLKEEDVRAEVAWRWFPVMCVSSGCWRALSYFASWYNTLDDGDNSWMYSGVFVAFLVARYAIVGPASRLMFLRSPTIYFVPFEVATALCTAYQRDVFWSTCYVLFAYVLEAHVFEQQVARDARDLWIQALVLQWLGASLSSQFLRVMIVLQVIQFLHYDPTDKEGGGERGEMSVWLIYCRFLWCMLLLQSVW